MIDNHTWIYSDLVRGADTDLVSIGNESVHADLGIMTLVSDHLSHVVPSRLTNTLSPRVKVVVLLANQEREDYSVLSSSLLTLKALTSSGRAQFATVSDV